VQETSHTQESVSTAPPPQLLTGREFFEMTGHKTLHVRRPAKGMQIINDHSIACIVTSHLRSICKNIVSFYMTTMGGHFLSARLSHYHDTLNRPDTRADEGQPEVKKDSCQKKDQLPTSEEIIVCVCVYIYIYIHVCTYVRTCVMCIYIYAHMYVRVCTYIYMCIYIYMCVCVCVCVCVYTHTREHNVEILLFHTLKTVQGEQSGQDSHVTVSPNGNNASQSLQEARENTANSTLSISRRRVTFGHPKLARTI